MQNGGGDPAFSLTAAARLRNFMGKVTDKHGNPLKAYSVQADEYGCVRFASSNVVARRDGAGELEVEFNEIQSCRRIPELDKYAAQRCVPWKVLVEEHGWSQECGYCQRRVYNDEPDRVWDEEDHIYCSVECQARAEKRTREYALERQREEQIKSEAITAASQRFEGVTKFHAYLQRDGRVQVSFLFPGSQWSANWTVGDELVSISQCDLDAWKAYRAPYQTAEASA